MTIDPMNAPIFGDLVPADPPRPIKLATALLLGNVVVTAGYRFYTAFDASFSIFLIPMALAVWFALSVRAGRGWARTASTVLSCLSIAMTTWVTGYAMINEHSGLATTIDLAVLVVSAAMLVTAIRLMWLADVNDYFTP
jgi:hypothetical protein